MKIQHDPTYDRPEITGIPDLIEKEAAIRADSAAFFFRGKQGSVETKTCLDVLRDARRRASCIFQSIGTGKHIAIIGENSYAWVAAFLGVLGSGNVAVAIDKDLPKREIAWMLGEADASAVLVSNAYADQVEGTESLTVLTMKQLAADAESKDESFSFACPAKDDPACIFFTSGTTGHSKAVLLTHGNLAAEVSSVGKILDMGGGPVFSVLPFHHAYGLIAAVFDVYMIQSPIFLCNSLKRIREDLQLAKPVMMTVVPLFVENLWKQVTEGLRKQGKEEAFREGVRASRGLLKDGIDRRREIFGEILGMFGGELRTIISGGAYLDPVYIEYFRDIGIDVLNSYGTTECSPCISISSPECRRDGSLGLPVPELDMRISREGEIQVRGPKVMPGYYHNPQETANVFRDGWYCTGDLGRLDEDGYVYITGRIKNLIILSNGENISPEELEKDFYPDPGVKEVLVYEAENLIVAEIVPEDGFDGNEAYFTKLKEKINQGRPIYKQVARVVLRSESFLRNASGKIVRSMNNPSRDT